ncbi:hypothetical protein MP228_011045 [Amoeboaphelidium protococcarum]|nr:hypothetical protein MP228_011045 [Amoeboaphelidium protococcarum]
MNVSPVATYFVEKFPALKEWQCQECILSVSAADNIEFMSILNKGGVELYLEDWQRTATEADMKKGAMHASDESIIQSCKAPKSAKTNSLKSCEKLKLSTIQK